MVMARPANIGVLALQGGIAEHLRALGRLDLAQRGAGGQGVESRRVLRPADLEGLDGLILPGGESTAVGLLLASGGLGAAIREAAGRGLALWGTCMGAILLARSIVNDGRRHLSLMDIEVERNAYGAQLDSFVEPLDVAGLDGGPFPGVFIRAPAIRSVGADVTVLARAGRAIVACRQGRLLASTFHPELTDDTRFHGFFAGLAVSDDLREAPHTQAGPGSPAPDSSTGRSPRFGAA